MGDQVLAFTQVMTERALAIQPDWMNLDCWIGLILITLAFDATKFA